MDFVAGRASGYGLAGVNMYLAGAGRECCYGTEHLHTVPDGVSAVKYQPTKPIQTVRVGWKRPMNKICKFS
eukprot:1999955-Amphidinium_carterae.3